MRPVRIEPEDDARRPGPTARRRLPLEADSSRMVRQEGNELKITVPNPRNPWGEVDLATAEQSFEAVSAFLDQVVFANLRAE